MARRIGRVQRIKVLAHGTKGNIGVTKRLGFRCRYRAGPARIRPDHARMNREALPSDEPRKDAALDDRFEQPAEHVALGKAAVAVLRERGVVRHWLVQPEASEPAIR